MVHERFAYKGLRERKNLVGTLLILGLQSEDGCP